jgi:hypothetical protein
MSKKCCVKRGIDCIEDRCTGVVDIGGVSPVMVTVREGRVDGFPCGTCGRIYQIDGTPVYSTEGKTTFLKNRRIIYK